MVMCSYEPPNNRLYRIAKKHNIFSDAIIRGPINSVSGQRSVYGDLACEGFSSSGNPYVNATDGFKVEETSRVRMNA